MRRVFALLLGIAAGLAVARLLRSRRERAGEPADSRAEELRRKLATWRGVAAPAASVPEAGPPESETAGEEIDAARRRVHEQGRATVEEMQGSGGA